MPLFHVLISIICVYFLVLFLAVFNPTAFKALFTDPAYYYHDLKKQKYENERNENYLYFPARNNLTGVSKYIKEKSYGSYTFLLNTREINPIILDENGAIIYEWKSKLGDIWTDPDHVVQSNDPSLFHAYRAFLNEKTGSVYIMVSTRAPTNDTMGLVKLDRNGNVIWISDENVHHDLAFSYNSDESYILTRSAIYKKRAEFPDIKPPFMDESIVILDKNGKLVKSISFADLFSHPDYSFLIADIKSSPQDQAFDNGDIFHSNTIEVVPPEAIGKAPMLKEGHLMISFRNLDLLIIVDPEKEEITWASFGPWKGQHDPEIQADGTVFMFDNMGSFKEGSGGSRVLQVDLNTMKILWEYSGTKDEPFYSRRNGSIHVLPNQNVLVSESYAGRVFEVTRDKEIVWEYWNPGRLTFDESRHGSQHNGKEHIAAVFSAMRYKKEDLPFLMEAKK